MWNKTGLSKNNFKVCFANDQELMFHYPWEQIAIFDLLFVPPLRKRNSDTKQKSFQFPNLQGKVWPLNR